MWNPKAEGLNRGYAAISATNKYSERIQIQNLQGPVLAVCWNFCLVSEVNILLELFYDFYLRQLVYFYEDLMC